MNKLYFSYDAKTDLADIKEYITDELANPVAASSTIARITKSIRVLQDFAFAGAPLSSIASIPSDYRYLSVSNYMVFYHIIADAIYVDRILYGKSNYLRTLFGEDYDSSEKIKN